MQNKALLSTLLPLITAVAFAQSADSAFIKNMSSELMQNARAF